MQEPGIIEILLEICITLCAAAAKSLQSCPTLCDPIDGSPPGPAVPGILQARTLEWVAITSSNAWKWKVKVKWLSRVWLLATPWTAAYQAPPSMGFSRQEYWSGVPLPSPLISYCDINISLVSLLFSCSLSHNRFIPNRKRLAVEVYGGLLNDRGWARYKCLGGRLWRSSKGIVITPMTCCIWFFLSKMWMVSITQGLFED